ncbi:uncharacterized protein SPAPADRAFT_52101 [Spathaspora passalidarum NRRL Y-27907]|uniref:Chromatin modification-related protein EAF6 n=1 Tax=Spathaspora passalidarum (strain NRRL Y-27907 / 11-Y1) TaxID=619300 RepID=G3ATE5_SPAPN|nr:uncharacterized protein SPAPADRAFT_52101 [Spathaspora passalidarum NRRL Y-27907]EGW30908.1 hypothetical protein SPAPADRAFT_52101 [Spathaspora passalidarum NRRL Y-27907]
MASKEKDGKGSPSKVASSPKAAKIENLNINNKTEETNKPTSQNEGVENYNKLKNKLIQQIVKRQELTTKLTSLEDSIYQKELDYFEESNFGNIVKGFENFSKSGGGGSSGGSGGGGGGGGASSGFGGNKRRIVYTEDDHIFSLSSVNYIKGLMKRQGGNYGMNGSNNANKDDFDDYEDSIDPGSAGMKNANAASPGASITSGATAVSAASPGDSTSGSGTPMRKRKARVLDD